MNNSFFHLLVLFCLFSFAAHAFAQQVPLPPSDYVLDDAHILSVDDIANLNADLAQFEKQTTTEIAILTIPSLEGGNIDEFSQRVFDLWKIGQAGKDNGLLIVVALEDRKWRIQTGYGLEGTLPDVLIASIAQKNLVPRFKQKLYAEGIIDTINEIENYIQEDSSTLERYAKVVAGTGMLEPHSELLGMEPLILQLFLILIGLIWVKNLLGCIYWIRKYPNDKENPNKNYWLAVGVMLIVPPLFMSMFGFGFVIFGGIVSILLLGTSYALTIACILLGLVLVTIKLPLGPKEESLGFRNMSFTSGRSRGPGGSSSGSHSSGFGGGRSGGGGAGGGW